MTSTSDRIIVVHIQNTFLAASLGYFLDIDNTLFNANSSI